VIDKALVSAVRRELKAAADPSRAPAMQAYMKSAMPYYGVAMPGQQVIWKKLFRSRVIPDACSWRETTLAMWRGATFREERYGAIALTGEKAYVPWQTLDALPMYEEMIVAGAWWDYVDQIAGRRIGLLLRNHPAPMSRLMRRWSHSDDMWKRRTSIICQLGFKERTDLALLYDCIEPNLDDREFFICKAIGWALRQHAWTDPKEVQRYVRAHEDRLSKLSRREALKNIGGATRPVARS
jgi:3-methyladenine DNA glycosylase AlkD